MYIMYPEEFWLDTELKDKHVRRMRLNTIKKATSYLKHFKGVNMVFNQKGRMVVERYKAYNTLISYECHALPDRIEVKCDKIATDTDINLKYIAYLTR